MQWIIWILTLIALALIWLNRSRIRQADADIDEIRNSLYELRVAMKSLKADWNLKNTKSQTEILKLRNKIPQDRNPFYITKDCISCGSCQPECPVDAISEGAIFEIDPEKCIACGKCAKVCPVNACQPLFSK